MKNHLFISLTAGIALSAAALYFAFRNVPLADLVRYLGSINYFWLIPAIILVLLSFFIRALRWQYILASSHKIGIWHAFHPMMIGFMINCLFPGRLGEFARPAILQKKEKVPFGTGIATVAAERVFDVAALVTFAVITLTAIEINPDVEIRFGNFQLNRTTLEVLFHRIIQMGIVLIIGMFVVSIPSIRRVIHRVILALPLLFFFAAEATKTKIRTKVCEPLTGFIDNIAKGFTLLKYPKKLIVCSIYSLLVWIVAAVSYHIFSLGSPGVELSFTEMFAVMVIICLFIALPSVPGFWGLWEAGGVFAMSVFGVSPDAAAGFTLANHAVQMFPVIIVGIVSAIITSVNVWQISYEKKSAKTQTG
ncbi:MAG: lysylphosphatidylglycerol synthase transmembrane domain-containing protein [Desulfobacterales bacterium]|nr:lysylphosphatidylglycerol synthase transmembrane domain-containing protein [Desulfobacterales bacterium]